MMWFSLFIYIVSVILCYSVGSEYLDKHPHLKSNTRKIDLVTIAICPGVNSWMAAAMYTRL